MLSGQSTSPFSFSDFPFIQVNTIGLGGAVTILPGPAFSLSRLDLALSLTIQGTTGAGAFGYDATTTKVKYTEAGTCFRLLSNTQNVNPT